jgi:predicted ribosome quality control (RQC) complex YloA/Tae2 family protein
MAIQSLNWKEIDLVLDELHLAGCLIQDAHQSAHDRFSLSLFRSGERFRILVCLSSRYPRVHLLLDKPANPAKPFRFAGFLRAHIRGGRIVSAAQVDRERIVRMEIQRGDEKAVMWLRLWGSAANAIVTDEKGKILDAFHRRPNKKEVSGSLFDAAAAVGSQTKPRKPREEYEIRDLPGDGSFNEKICRYFQEAETAGDAERIRADIQAELDVRESKVLANLDKLEKRLKEYGGLERFKEIGDLITSNLHAVKRGDRWIKVEDFFHANAPLDIELSPELSPAENAEKYYIKYRKARDGMGKVADEIDSLRRMLGEIEKQRAALAEDAVSPGGSEAGSLAPLKKAAMRPKQAAVSEHPGLAFRSGQYKIMVGRSSAENDELLRSAVRGNDWWFHARDWPGAYVFVKAAQGKSLPLEVMLDAGNLAVHFSKGKSSGAGDVYYTQVKYLRRVKGAKRGLVIPTQEKNLRIKVEEARMQRLKEGGAF